MNAHLTEHQLSECILGQPNPLAARHIQSCPACASKLAEFQRTLGALRGAVRSWSENEANSALAARPAFDRRVPAPARQLAWALLIAAVCLIASFVLPRHSGESPASVPWAGDTALLNQVDAQVSRTAPASMEPLMNPVEEQSK